MKQINLHMYTVSPLNCILIGQCGLLTRLLRYEFRKFSFSENCLFKIVKLLSNITESLRL